MNGRRSGDGRDIQEEAPLFQTRVRTIRFGEFTVDLQLGEVRQSGVRLKLQEQPFKILQVLLERPGELVTRDELLDPEFGRKTPMATSIML